MNPILLNWTSLPRSKILIRPSNWSSLTQGHFMVMGKTHESRLLCLIFTEYSARYQISYGRLTKVSQYIVILSITECFTLLASCQTKLNFVNIRIFVAIFILTVCSTRLTLCQTLMKLVNTNKMIHSVIKWKERTCIEIEKKMTHYI